MLKGWRVSGCRIRGRNGLPVYDRVEAETLYLGVPDGEGGIRELTEDERRWLSRKIGLSMLQAFAGAKRTAR